MDARNPVPLTFLAIAGSLRRLSFNRGLIRAAVERAPLGITVQPYDYSDVPLYNGDGGRGRSRARHPLQAGDRQGRWAPHRDAEYNHCVPGVLKNAIDWASRPARASVLSGKPVAIMGATPGQGGTARAQQQLRDGLAYTNGYVLPLPEVLVPEAGRKFDRDSDLIDDETRVQIIDVLKAFGAWTRRMQAPGLEELVAS